MTKQPILAVALLWAAMAPALASEATGVWLREDGKTKVRFAACGGEALCGTIIWLRDKDSPARLGQKVFFDMTPNGEGVWAGSAFNPEDGKTYSGKIALNGGVLRTSGCALGGLICKSFNWRRAE